MRVALPRLSDSLRSLALSRNLSCCALPALLVLLSEQAPLSLLNCPLRVERCVRTLVKLVPEFVQILPADDFLAHESVRINLQAPYRSVRLTVKAAADAANKKKQELLRRVQHNNVSCDIAN